MHGQLIVNFVTKLTLSKFLGKIYCIELYPNFWENVQFRFVSQFLGKSTVSNCKTNWTKHVAIANKISVTHFGRDYQDTNCLITSRGEKFNAKSDHN